MKNIASLTTPKERVLFLIVQLGLSQRGFEQCIGVSNGALRGINTRISIKMLDKIKEAFPEVNIDWLRYGAGQIFVDKVVPEEENLLDKLCNELQSQREAITLLTQQMKELQECIKALAERK